MDYKIACRIVGNIYGHVLHRDADPEGYDYHVKGLNEGRYDIHDLLLKFYTSEEFAEKFVINQTPNELARNLLNNFFDPNTILSEDYLHLRKLIAKSGLEMAISWLISETRYIDRHGRLGIPRYTEARPTGETA